VILDFQYVILNVIHSNENRLAELYNGVKGVTIQMKAIEHNCLCSFAVLFGSDACVTTLSALSETVASYSSFENFPGACIS